MLKAFLKALRREWTLLFNNQINEIESTQTRSGVELRKRGTNLVGSNFAVDDTITINSPDHPLWHGKKGTIKRIRFDSSGGHIVNVTDDKGKDVLVELTANQMIKIIKDPAFTRFVAETLPVLTKQSPSEHNPVQEHLQQRKETEQTETRDEKIFKAGLQEGYVRGFSEGYVVGYQAAMADVQQLFVQHGLTQPKLNPPGESDGNTKA